MKVNRFGKSIVLGMAVLIVGCGEGKPDPQANPDSGHKINHVSAPGAIRNSRKDLLNGGAIFWDYFRGGKRDTTVYRANGTRSAFLRGNELTQVTEECFIYHPDGNTPKMSCKQDALKTQIETFDAAGQLVSRHEFSRVLNRAKIVTVYAANGRISFRQRWEPTQASLIQDKPEHYKYQLMAVDEYGANGGLARSLAYGAKSGRLIAVYVYDARGVAQSVAPEKVGVIDPSHLAFPPWEDAGPYLRGEKF
jgi:hypothetical protein